MKITNRKTALNKALSASLYDTHCVLYLCHLPMYGKVK